MKMLKSPAVSGKRVRLYPEKESGCIRKKVRPEPEEKGNLVQGGEIVMKQGEKRINREKILSRQGGQKSHEVSVEFTYHAPQARQVSVVGDFNNWDLQAVRMRKTPEGSWKASVTLNPGRYEYKYFADGAWVDGGPDAEKAQNAFGTDNLVVYV